MHAIQTSGNCIRNVTADHFAGAAADEIADPAPLRGDPAPMVLRHPEFSFLPRKFKIAITGAPSDRAATRCTTSACSWCATRPARSGSSDRRRRARAHADDRQGARLPAGRGSPAYSEAILRSTTCYGRRDNKYKARIKILVHETGLEHSRRTRNRSSRRSASASCACRTGSPPHRGLFRAAAAGRAATSEACRCPQGFRPAFALCRHNLARTGCRAIRHR
jgi:sulfite reductase beta subunit-like hemoprotein